MCYMLADMFSLFVLGGFSVFAGVGERTREGNDLYREMIESGVIKLGDKQVTNTYLFIKIHICIVKFLTSLYCYRVRASACLWSNERAPWCSCLCWTDWFDCC
jgi:hypothetical protein